MKYESSKEIRITYSLDQLDEVVQRLMALRQTCAVFAFMGSLGAGKTTLVRALLKAWGIQGSITSPTFTYVNMYTTHAQETLYHFDCYRITSVNDFVAAGFDEYLYQPHSWSFIEWPEVIMPLLDHAVCHIHLHTDGDGMERVMTYRVIP